MGSIREIPDIPEEVRNEPSLSSPSAKNQPPKSVIIPQKVTGDEQSFLDLMDEDISEVPVFVDGQENITLKAAWDEDERSPVIF